MNAVKVDDLVVGEVYADVATKDEGYAIWMEYLGRDKDGVYFKHVKGPDDYIEQEHRQFGRCIGFDITLKLDYYVK